MYPEYSDIIKADPSAFVSMPEVLISSIQDNPRRESAMKLLRHLECETNWIYCPASKKYHQNYTHGLIKHSIEVVILVHNFNRTAVMKVPDDSITTVGLFHDIGKTNVYKIDEFGFISYKNVKPINSAEESLRIILPYVHLTQDEIRAILWHDGLYVPENKELIGKETPLWMCIHWADMWSAHRKGANGQEG